VGQAGDSAGRSRRRDFHCRTATGILFVQLEQNQSDGGTKAIEDGNENGFDQLFTLGSV